MASSRISLTIGPGHPATIIGISGQMRTPRQQLDVAATSSVQSLAYREVPLLPRCDLYWQLAEVGTRNFFWSPQSQFRNLKEALPQSQFRNFLKKCCSATAIPQSQFFLMSATSNPQLESFISAIFGIFLAVESGCGSWKKLEVKNLVQLSL